MKRKPSAVPTAEAHLIRFAWLASFLTTLALIAILGVVRSAEAMPMPPSAPTTSVLSSDSGEEESEAEEEETEAWECEAAEAEEQAECEAEAAEAAAEEEAPRRCVLSSADATVSAATSSNRIKLAIRYTAYSPAAVQVVYFLRGAKGPLSFDSEQSRVGRHGIIRDADTLTTAQMSKALAARSFTVELRPANVPHYCDGLLDRHLTVRHNASGRLTWLDPGPASTASRLG